MNNLITSAAEKVIVHLRDDNMVDSGDFGKFQCQLSSMGAVSIDEFSHHNIRKARFQFRPGKLIRKALDNVGFEHVMTLESQREAKRRERAADAQQP